MDQNISIRLEKIRAHFFTELGKQYHQVGMLRDQLDRVADPSQTYREIGRICHKIAGTAAPLGFPELGHVAAKIDDLVASRGATKPDAGFEIREHADHLLVLMSLLLDDESMFA